MAEPNDALRFGVIGCPIDHSLSPVLQRELFAHIRLDASYEAIHVEPEDLSKEITAMRDQNIRGLNVTAPHKQAVIKHLDEVSEGAQLLGAANTIFNEDGRLVGLNTDVAGFRTSMRSNGILALDERAVVLGAGGAAAAVCHALILDGIESIEIYNRSLDRANLLAAKFSQFESSITARSLDDPALANSIAESKLLIQTTPVGTGNVDRMLDLPLEGLGSHHVVVDLVYNPTQTRFLREAELQGAKILNGLDMLIYQGVKSLEIWLESSISSVPVNEIKKILEDAIDDEPIAISDSR